MPVSIGLETVSNSRSVPVLSDMVMARRYVFPQLSDYSGAKVIVECDKCGMRKRYDTAAMLDKIGDHALPDLLKLIAMAEGCPKVNNDWYDRCTLHYDIATMNAARGRSPGTTAGP